MILSKRSLHGVKFNAFPPYFSVWWTTLCPLWWEQWPKRPRPFTRRYLACGPPAVPEQRHWHVIAAVTATTVSHVEDYAPPPLTAGQALFLYFYFCIFFTANCFVQIQKVQLYLCLLSSIRKLDLWAFHGWLPEPLLYLEDLQISQK